MNLYYFQTNIICIVILLIIFVSIKNRTNTLPARSVAFNRLLIIIAVICISDILAWHFSGMHFSGARALNYISNIIFDAGITWAGFAWLNYVEIRIGIADKAGKKSQLLKAVPLVIMLLLLVTDPWTKLLFSIDEYNVYSRSGGIFIHWIISWFYLFYATAEVFERIRKSTSRAEKEQFTPMIWFVVPPIVAAIAQMFFYGVSSTQCGMTLAALIIALNFMIGEVSKDSLTGLNNRRAFETAVSERLQRGERNFTVLMCDVDKFKTINDTLGHSAGDIVLKRMSQALKRACANEYRSLILCRYGGDEFVVCGTNMPDTEIEKLISKIESNIDAINDEYGNELSFGISIGMASDVCSSYEEIKELVKKADTMMYEVKQKKKAER